MGYFSNGSEGINYEARFCDHCIHQNGPDGKSGCAIWLAHMLYNYDECDNEKSILHLLIPRSKNGLDNERCLLFWRIAKPSGGEPEPVVERTDADRKYLDWQREKMTGHEVTTEPANPPKRRKVA